VAQLEIIKGAWQQKLRDASFEWVDSTRLG